MYQRLGVRRQTRTVQLTAYRKPETISITLQPLFSDEKLGLLTEGSTGRSCNIKDL